jgi:Family of unknown function (DUF6314)
VTADPWDLIGRWTLARRVADRLTGQQGTVRGTLSISSDGDGLRWDESGVLAWGGQEHPVARAYLLRERGDGWWVEFVDGREFHPWRPGVAVTHPCRADVYTGLVTVDGPRMRTCWDVRGPGKEQRLVTRFYRSAAIESGVSVGS